jgi:hypothetical protein
MTMSREKKHILEVGRERFHKSLVLANMCVRADSRFVGLDRIRNRIVHQAALQATGYPRAPLSLTDLGHIPAETQQAADEVFARAIEAARGR